MTKILSISVAILVGVPVVAFAGDTPEWKVHHDRIMNEIYELSSISRHPDKKMCDAKGKIRCHARKRLRQMGMTYDATNPGGLNPTDLRNAYNIPSGGAGKIIAIVDAQDDPSAEADMGVYRAKFGLPLCTTANGCFKKVNQNGVQGSYPTADAGWSGEIALDLDMASAGCPACKIILVEANSASMNDLGTAVNAAAKLGATVISNSYGGPEDSSVTGADTKYFNHPGIAIFVSAGDNGYGAEYPASSQYVTAVGGTSLIKSTSNARGWTEGVWGESSNANGGTGSGCSAYITKPNWQKDAGCSKRTVADISAVADPNTGVAVYNSYQSDGWDVYGGTSASSPLVASIYAATGHGADTAQLSYAQPNSFYDVITGTNGSCNNSYLCVAGVGYDGPTGNGSPNGQALGTVTICTPNCTGKQCGSDGCTGICGTCPTGQTCNSSGTCVAPVCTPNCTGKQCGSDGCSGTCGTCPTGQTCGAGGLCTLTTCTPSCTGKQCGPDGCGGVCGICTTGQTCNSSGTCTPNGGCSGSLMINEISTRGATASDEIIQLYNSGCADANLAGYKLYYRAAATINGLGTLLTSFGTNTKVPAGKHYLLGSKGSYSGNVALDATFNADLADSGSVWLFKAAPTVFNLVKTDTNFVDLVGWGTAVSHNYEGSGPAPSPKKAFEAIIRTNGKDTNNNAADFTLAQTRNLQNSLN